MSLPKFPYNLSSDLYIGDPDEKHSVIFPVHKRYGTPSSDISFRTLILLLRENDGCTDCHTHHAVRRKTGRQTSRFLDGWPWSLVLARWVRLQKLPGYSVADQIRSCDTETTPKHHGFGSRSDYERDLVLYSLWRSKGEVSLLLYSDALAEN